MKIELRKCTIEDWDYVLALRNEFYKNSFYKQDRILTKDEHYDYMENQSKNPNFHQWIAIMDGKIVGYIRILDSDINIMVSKEFQNQGLGEKMLELLEVEARKLKIKKLIGLVKIDNHSSQKIFEKNSYELKLNWFEKTLD